MAGNRSQSFLRAYDDIIRVVSKLSEVVSGKEDELKLIIATIVAGGHVLIEGPPGSAKTLIAYGLSRVIGGKFKRAQGNPDLLPADLTGYHVYSLDGKSRFVEALFSQIS